MENQQSYGRATLDGGGRWSGKNSVLGLSIPSRELTEKQKGMYYFHMARFILFFEAWTGNSDTPHLLEFISLFQKGLRYF